MWVLNGLLVTFRLSTFKIAIGQLSSLQNFNLLQSQVYPDISPLRMSHTENTGNRGYSSHLAHKISY